MKKPMFSIGQIAQLKNGNRLPILAVKLRTEDEDDIKAGFYYQVDGVWYPEISVTVTKKKPARANQRFMQWFSSLPKSGNRKGYARGCIDGWNACLERYDIKDTRHEVPRCFR